VQSLQDYFQGRPIQRRNGSPARSQMPSLGTKRRIISSEIATGLTAMPSPSVLLPWASVIIQRPRGHPGRTDMRRD
jgi:hypothetical protein